MRLWVMDNTDVSEACREDIGRERKERKMWELRDNGQSGPSAHTQAVSEWEDESAMSFSVGSAMDLQTGNAQRFLPARVSPARKCATA